MVCSEDEMGSLEQKMALFILDARRRIFMLRLNCLHGESSPSYGPQWSEVQPRSLGP
jgi:hypothetical protein